MTAATEQAVPGGPDRTPSRRLPRYAAALASAAALVAAGWWGAHPSAYPDYGFAETGPLPAPGRSLLAGVGPHPAHGSATLAEVTPVVVENSADAVLRVVVCDAPRDGAPPGVVVSTAEEYCGHVRRVDGYVQHAQRVGPGAPTPGDADGQVVLQITPRRPGTVAVSGVRFRYATGLRRGEQTFDVGMRFTTR